MFISNIFLSGRKRPEVNQIKIRAVRSGATEALNTVLEQALKIPIHMYNGYRQCQNIYSIGKMKIGYRIQ